MCFDVLVVVWVFGVFLSFGLFDDCVCWGMVIWWSGGLASRVFGCALFVFCLYSLVGCVYIGFD